MVTYQCPRCHYQCNKPDDYRRHLGRKVACDPKYGDVELKLLMQEFQAEQSLRRKKFSCPWCPTTSVSEQALLRHSTSCPEKEVYKLVCEARERLNPGSAPL